MHVTSTGVTFRWAAVSWGHDGRQLTPQQGRRDRWRLRRNARVPSAADALRRGHHLGQRPPSGGAKAGFLDLTQGRSTSGAAGRRAAGSHVAMTTDEHAERFVLLRPLLFTIAYEMLGSATESDDVLQDSYLRWAEVDLATVRDTNTAPSGPLCRRRPGQDGPAGDPSARMGRFDRARRRPLRRLVPHAARRGGHHGRVGSRPRLGRRPAAVTVSRGMTWWPGRRRARRDARHGEPRLPSGTGTRVRNWTGSAWSRLWAWTAVQVGGGTDGLPPT